MLSTYWLKKRRAQWAELSGLLKRTEKHGLRDLEHFEVQRVALLYRQSAADLSALRQDPSGSSYVRYLSPILTRAHNIIYRSRSGEKKRLLEFFVREFPRTCRANSAYLAAALIIFLASALVGSILTLQDPDFALHILGPGMIRTIEKKEMWTHSIVAIKPIASSEIMTNNLSVSFTMFAMGITAGVGTVVLTSFNGLLLGVIATACGTAGMGKQLWSFVAPHGALELPAIIIAAAAGLKLAKGLLFPGVLPRRDSLVLEGSEAVKMILGVIPMLIIAGVIEGFVSPTQLHAPMKFLLGAALFALLIFYLFFSNWTTAKAA